MLACSVRPHCMRQLTGKLPHTIHTNLVLRTIALGANRLQRSNIHSLSSDSINHTYGSGLTHTNSVCTHSQKQLYIPRQYISYTPHPPVRISCAYQGKPRRPAARPSPINTYNTPTQPHLYTHLDHNDTNMARLPDSGEDAFFVHETDDAHYIGVADGVGGWQEMGVDPALFAWALMNHTRDAIREGMHLDIRDALKYAHEKIVEDGLVTHGSSTACVVKVEKKTRIMTVCNLGDSGLQIYDRDGKLAARTPSQQHGFNFPYQLAVMPPDMREGAMMHTMADGDLFQYQMKDEQVMLLATDGLFDNMFPSDIEATFKEVGVGNMDKLATSLVRKAESLSKDQRRRSPFTVEAEKHGYTDMLGGKPDDITLIVLAV
ncbi:hypothetical protein SARC_01840 [Sphaeroforma arctica JP610]|uniref:Protein phosphatase n=1 Tax=Sphaeroforma arctica JP610 TaxID=667725 RepID=A0A0L0GAH9_9EUKA|nr:hypothetical protein SARC_01840 [Sphaeroforma arctica JP610]KNC85995.1 hypothetical protein SARC_01840 [Sphaeroforma arctica JP610]|eukprot:XP_014159897.1 hypothetical protein SARC_01840 [Sphaeroforma arctica JP610]